MSDVTTQQDTKHVPNPTGKGGFGDNPQNRNPGGWDKTKSISYQYNRMLRMTDKEWDELTKRIESGDTFRAERIAYKRIKEADNDLQTTKEITDRTEGKAPQFIGTGDKDDYNDAFTHLTTEELRKLAGSTAPERPEPNPPSTMPVGL